MRNHKNKRSGPFVNSRRRSALYHARAFCMAARIQKKFKCGQQCMCGQVAFFHRSLLYVVAAVFWRAGGLIGGPAGCTDDRRAGRRAAEKGGVGCRKGQPSGPTFSEDQLTVQPASPLTRPVMQPAGPPFCAAHQPRRKINFFIWQHGPPGRPGPHLVLSYFLQ